MKDTEEDRDEFTGFNAQADPEFLYEADEQLVSEQTKDLYSDLETISVEPKKLKPFKYKEMAKQTFTGIEKGRRTIEIVNPDYSVHKRKSNALRNSIEIWQKRVTDLEDEISNLSENWSEEDEKFYNRLLAERKKTLKTRQESLEDLGPEPVMMITKITDVVVPAPELFKHEKEKEEARLEKERVEKEQSDLKEKEEAKERQRLERLNKKKNKDTL